MCIKIVALHSCTIMFVHDSSSVRIVILVFYENMFFWFSQKLAANIYIFLVQKFHIIILTIFRFENGEVTGLSNLLKNFPVLYRNV